MKSKKLSLVCSIGLVLVLVLTTILAACAQEAAAPGAPTRISPQVPTQQPSAVTPTTPTPAKPAPAPEAEVLKWMFQAHNSPGSTEWKIYEDFKQRVEALAGGRIEITLNPSGSLCPPNEVFNATASGLLDVGWSDPAYHKGFMPHCEIGTAPFMMQSLDDALEVYYYTDLKKVWGAPYLEHGVTLLGLTSHGEIPLMTSKPVNRVTDFQGMKIRTIGGRATMLDELGASTTYIPGDEVYAALASGLVEGATWGTEGSFVPKGWHEVCKYIIYPALTAYPVGCNDIFMRTELWASLPEDIQNIMRISADAMFPAYAYISIHDDILNRPTLDAAGVTRCYLPQEDYPALAKAASTVWTQIAEKGPVAKEVVRIMTDYMRLKGYTDYKID